MRRRPKEPLPDRHTSLMLRAGTVCLAVLLSAVAIGRPFGNLPPPEHVVSRFEERRLSVLLGTWLEAVAAALLLLFATGLRARLDDEHGADSGLGGVALAGGAVTAAMMLGRAASVAAAAERSEIRHSPLTAAFAVDLGNLLVGKMAPIGLALMTATVAVSGRRGGPVPAWLAGVSGVLTVGLLSPVNFLFIVPGMAWVATAGWVLGRHRSGKRQTEDTR